MVKVESGATGPNHGPDVTSRKHDADGEQERPVPLASRHVKGGTLRETPASRARRQDHWDGAATYREFFEECPVSLWEEDWSAMKRRLESLLDEGVTDLRAYFRDNPEELRDVYDLAKVVAISRQALRIYRASSEEEMIQFTKSRYSKPAELAAFAEQIVSLLEGAASFEYESPESACDGAELLICVRTVVPRSSRHSWARVLMSVEDVTERRRDQEALRESEGRYREVFEESPISLWEEDWSDLRRMLDDLAAQGISDLRTYFHEHPESLRAAYDAPRIVDISRAALRVYRASSKEELVAVSGSDHADPGELEAFAEQLAYFYKGVESYEYETREVACDGSVIFTRMRTAIPPQHRATWSRVLVSIEDITLRRRMLNALSRSEIRYREIFDQAPIAILEQDWSAVRKLLDGLASQGVTDIAAYFRTHPDELGAAYDAADRFGISQAAVELYRAGSKAEFAAAMTRERADPDELRGYGEMIAAFYGGAESYAYEAREIACDGTDIVTRIRAVIPANHGEDWGRVLVSMEDITQRRLAEEQLQRAQKMQAVGQLTGGVAHDFNNLLAVILGNAEILATQLDPDDPGVKPIIRAASRGAELTQKLLAFSRQQSLAPQAVDLADLVAGMSGLLSRTLGETIRVEASTPPGLWRAMADLGQLESAILNLAINARDAMPGGGRLVIEAANVPAEAAEEIADAEEPADYVRLSVTDEGTGMSPEEQARAFEPFFTTKEIGQGSGLGLSMVYGFAKQSGGYAAIDSEAGRGTTIHLFLPRAEIAPAEVEPAPRGPEPQGHGEVILVLEDDLDVRELTVSLLSRMGYEVLQAADGRAAERVLGEASRIDLLLSDVVLPGGISGPDFAETARRRHPDITVLFMSGYANDTSDQIARLGAGAVLLHKPFHPRVLAQQVGSALARRAASADIEP